MENHPSSNSRDLGIHDEDVAPIESDADLKGKDGSGEIEPDESLSLRARQEAARLHGDAFLVRSDLEDDDQRNATPGMREQD